MGGSDFCCFGCEAAFSIINKIGLGSYYSYRKLDPNVRKIKPDNQDQIDLHSFIKKCQDDKNEILLAIDGIHCAACVWLIETILLKQENIISARVNLSKKYLKIKWFGAEENCQKYINLISEIGYKLFPFDENILLQEERKYNNDLVKCLAVSGFAAGNIMLFSIILWFYDQQEIGHAMKVFMQFFSSLIALPAIIYSSRPFFKSAFVALKNKSGNMDVPIAVAIFLASLVSLIQAFNQAKHVYFDSAIMLVFFLLIGRYLDFKARKKAFDLAREFTLINSSYARLVNEEGLIKIIASKDIKRGMKILILAGDKVAADGIIIQGQAEFDSSIVNGETVPKLFSFNQNIFAGMINISSPVVISVTKEQDESLIAEIAKIVDDAQAQKNSYVRIADRLARIYTPAVHIAALFTFIFWFYVMQSGLENSVLNAIAILVITCPCALALAVPITQTLTISSLLKRGVLAKSGDALESVNDIDIFVFDKTGTITFGNPVVVDFSCINRKLDFEEEDFYKKLAASICQYSKHPFSKAISLFYEQIKLNLDVTEHPSMGLSSSYKGHEVKIGSATFLEINDKNNNILLNKIYLKYKDDIILFSLKDELKKDAKFLIEYLQKLNKRIVLLSGDSKDIVINIANKVGIKEYYFEHNLMQKSIFIKDLKKQNHKILMVGDGINDAASLNLADISISFIAASELSKNTADIIVQGQNLSPIIDFLNISKRSMNIIKQNLLIALCYNIIAIPFAFMGYVSPLVAAFAMSSSSILVVLNSIKILSYKNLYK